MSAVSSGWRPQHLMSDVGGNLTDEISTRSIDAGDRLENSDWAVATHQLPSLLGVSVAFFARYLGGTAPAESTKPTTESRRSRDFEGISEAFRQLDALRSRASKLEVEASGRLVSALRDASNFCRKLPSGVPSPNINASEDGEVVIEWHTSDGGGIIVGFEGSSQFGYAIRRNQLFEPGKFPGLLDSAPLPADLLEALAG